MFIGKYVNDFYFDLIMNEYDKQYLNSLDEANFVKIYNLFKKYNFYFISDIILNYLEIFEMDYDDVEDKIICLEEKLGNNFIKIIGNDMSYLVEILND